MGLITSNYEWFPQFSQLKKAKKSKQTQTNDLRDWAYIRDLGDNFLLRLKWNRECRTLSVEPEKNMHLSECHRPWNNNNNNNNQLYQKQFTFFIINFSKSTSSAILVLFQFQSSRDKMCKSRSSHVIYMFMNYPENYFFFVIDVLKLTKPTRKTISTTPMIEEIKRKKGSGKKCAPAGSRTRVNGLGSRHDNRYTTSAHALRSGEILVIKLLMPQGKIFFLLYGFFFQKS